MEMPEGERTLPSDVEEALEGILNDVYTMEVRKDIVESLTWGINNARPSAKYLNDLGLCVWDGKLHVVHEGSGESKAPSEVAPNFETEIPSDIQETLDKIYKEDGKEGMDRKGTDLRRHIAKVLRYGTKYVSSIAGFASDLGLTVVDGELCVIFYPES